MHSLLAAALVVGLAVVSAACDGSGLSEETCNDAKCCLRACCTADQNWCSPPPCTTDDSCGSPDLFLCKDGNCVARFDTCNSDACCGKGFVCVTTDEALDPYCQPKCGADGSCPKGYGCTAGGLCTAYPAPCSGVSSCSSGDVCVVSRCTAACFHDSDCPSGMMCSGGGCVVDRSSACPMENDGDASADALTDADAPAADAVTADAPAADAPAADARD